MIAHRSNAMVLEYGYLWFATNQASESFDLPVEMKERIQPKWPAGLRTKTTRCSLRRAWSIQLITQLLMLMFNEMSQKQKMNMKQEKN
jgi:hypothetical protein